MVAEWIYDKIPSVLKLLFTPKDIEELIEGTLAEVKLEWDTNTNLKDYINSGILTCSLEPTTTSFDKNTPDNIKNSE